jgi:hypothetical protein
MILKLLFFLFFYAYGTLPVLFQEPVPWLTSWILPGTIAAGSLPVKCSSLHTQKRFQARTIPWVFYHRDAGAFKT